MSATLNGQAHRSRMDSDWLAMIFHSSARKIFFSESDSSDIVIIIALVWILLFLLCLDFYSYCPECEWAFNVVPFFVHVNGY